MKRNGQRSCVAPRCVLEDPRTLCYGAQLYLSTIYYKQHNQFDNLGPKMDFSASHDGYDPQQLIKDMECFLAESEDESEDKGMNLLSLPTEVLAKILDGVKLEVLPRRMDIVDVYFKLFINLKKVDFESCCKTLWQVSQDHPERGQFCTKNVQVCSSTSIRTADLFMGLCHEWNITFPACDHLGLFSEDQRRGDNRDYLRDPTVHTQLSLMPEIFPNIVYLNFTSICKSLYQDVPQQTFVHLLTVCGKCPKLRWINLTGVVPRDQWVFVRGVLPKRIGFQIGGSS